MKSKRRRIFKGYVDDKLVCHGVLYDQSNVQVLWRIDIGYTGEQYNTISNVFFLIPGLNTIKIEG